MSSIRWPWISGGTRTDVSGQLSRRSVHYVSHKSSGCWQDSAERGGREDLWKGNTRPSASCTENLTHQASYTRTPQRWFSPVDAQTHTRTQTHAASWRSTFSHLSASANWVRGPKGLGKSSCCLFLSQVTLKMRPTSGFFNSWGHCWPLDYLETSSSKSLWRRIWWGTNSILAGAE